MNAIKSVAYMPMCTTHLDQSCIHRCKTSGAYHAMVAKGQISHWAVVDLRSTTSNQPRQHSASELVHVLFSPDFSSASVTGPGHPAVTVHLQKAK